MLARHLKSAILASLADTPVVFLRGARQTGKSTVMRLLAASEYPARYLTFDDAAVLAAARHDPPGFLRSLLGPAVIDEAQRVPELFLAIKAVVDSDPSPGRFLLTGSADILHLPRISESLAGRMEILTLWPFSQGELAGAVEGFVDALFAKTPRFPSTSPEQRSRLIARILQGGYPALLRRPSEGRKRAWMASYVTAVLQRDVRDISNIEDLTAMPRLLALLASRAGSLLNFADVARSLSMPHSTLKRYFALLETTFLVRLVPAWSANLGKPLVKSPKLYLNDTGLMSYLLGLNESRLAEAPMMLRPLLENFVAMELSKQAGWSMVRTELFHFRLAAGPDVDFVLENDAGEIVGIEVKASSTVASTDFKGLRNLAELTGKRFRRGVVLYTGAEALPFGAGFHALPVTCLWSTGAGRPRLS
jgi:predicted AAA+ superfamily ATPase